MAELGNFTINVSYPDAGDIEAFGELIGKLVEAKYKKMLEEQSAADTANVSHELLKRFTSLISETNLYKSVCCGMGVGTEQKSAAPFIVQQGQVYINQSIIKFNNSI